MDLDNDEVAQRARLEDIHNDSDRVPAKNVEVILPDNVLSNVELQPTVDARDSSVTQPNVPNFLHSDPIYPNQGVPLQEPDEPILHPTSGEKLYPVVYEEIFGKHRLSSGDWVKVEKICSLLEHFYEITNAFSGREYPTANLYFYSIWKIQRLLLSAVDGGDTCIAHMASKMYEKFDKYWHEFSPILSFAVILDPRYKYDFVMYSLKKLHGDLTGANKANVLYVKFVELYKDYENKMAPVQPIFVSREEIGCGDLEEFDVCYGSSKRLGGTEYEKYFSDDKESRTIQLDVLSFWSKNVEKYPILSSMAAKDILAIPITTVASESTFSMGGRIVNKWRSSLLSQNVEALVTTRNWLFGYEDLEKLGVEVGQSENDEDW